MINARRVVAQIVTRVFDFAQLAPPYKSDLAARLGDSGFRAAVGPEVSRKADTLRKIGNRAVHETRPITATSALAVLRQLHDLLRWAAVGVKVLADGRAPPLRLRRACWHRLLTMRSIPFTNFVDEIRPGSIVALPGISVGTNWERFKAKARAYVKDHEDNVTVQKLRRNKQLTATDLTALEELLAASGAGSADDIERASEESQGLGLFIRSLVGLDREAAAEAFSEFLTDSRFTAAEIRFVQLIVEHLTANGVMEARRLYEAPFTDHAPTGPDQLFAEADIDRMIVILDTVRAHAQAEETVA